MVGDEAEELREILKDHPKLWSVYGTSAVRHFKDAVDNAEKCDLDETISNLCFFYTDTAIIARKLGLEVFEPGEVGIKLGEIEKSVATKIKQTLIENCKCSFK